MIWQYVVTILVCIVAFYVMKAAGQISRKSAKQYLRDGAMLVDVRSAEEFQQRHLPKAINIPSTEIEAVLPRTVKDKDKVLLLHCESGLRSGAAKKTARKLGYKYTYNLGSFDRALKILSGR
jgi:phage shock protein E